MQSAEGGIRTHTGLRPLRPENDSEFPDANNLQKRRRLKGYRVFLSVFEGRKPPQFLEQDSCNFLGSFAPPLGTGFTLWDNSFP